MWITLLWVIRPAKRNESRLSNPRLLYSSRTPKERQGQQQHPVNIDSDIDMCQETIYVLELDVIEILTLSFLLSLTVHVHSGIFHLGRFPSARSGLLLSNEQTQSFTQLFFIPTDFSQWDIPSRAVPQCPLRFACVEMNKRNLSHRPY